MRRPTRAQLLRRRTAAFVVPLLVSVLVALALVSSDGDGRADETAGPATTEAAPADSTEAADATSTTTAGPSTTASTGAFLPATLLDGPVVGEGTLHTYRVEVEDGTGVPVDDFAADVERILSDPRGWTAADGISLQRVFAPEAEFTITLATAGTVNFLCYPLDTSEDGGVSCAKEGRAILNLERWMEGAEPSQLDLARYREYLVSHEVGHVLGHHHVPCPGPGQLAPVMVQQTLGIGECAPNPWPAPDVQAG